MLDAILTQDSDAITCEIDIDAPPERVFKAISDAEEVRRRSPGIVYEMDTRVGGRWWLEMRPPQPYRGLPLIRHEGEILVLDPPRLLVHTWFANFHKDPNHSSVVRWELSPTKTGTHVRLSHTGLRTEPESAKDYSQGWPGVLQELKTFLEHSAKTR
jgi:uncharacterized protein YndB with AHSA1/START domain